MVGVRRMQAWGRNRIKHRRKHRAPSDSDLGWLVMDSLAEFILCKFREGRLGREIWRLAMEAR